MHLWDTASPITLNYPPHPSSNVVLQFPHSDPALMGSLSLTKPLHTHTNTHTDQGYPCRLHLSVFVLFIVSRTLIDSFLFPFFPPNSSVQPHISSLGRQITSIPLTCLRGRASQTKLSAIWSSTHTHARMHTPTPSSSHKYTQSCWKECVCVCGGIHIICIKSLTPWNSFIITKWGTMCVMQIRGMCVEGIWFGLVILS